MTIADDDDAVTLPEGRWTGGSAPPNVRLGPNTLLTGADAFTRFHSERDPGLVVGTHTTLDAVRLSVGPEGRIQIGDYCFFSQTALLCEAEIRIGSHVLFGWNVTVADTDFHPVAPAARLRDAIACSPHERSRGMSRPPYVRRPVVIEDDVYVGPNAVILKGVRVGVGAWVEPGALITRDVPPGARVAGNPARIIAEA